MWGEVGRCDSDETSDGRDENFASVPPPVVEGYLEAEGAR